MNALIFLMMEMLIIEDCNVDDFLLSRLTALT